jgi:uncharacterized membrane protein YhaH (DUF805 family)
MKMTFVGAVKSGFVNFRKFKGTATRREYWFFILAIVLIGIVLSTIESIIWPPIETEDIVEALNQPTPLTTIGGLLLLIPNLSATSRRIQDSGWSARWLFLHLLWIIPMVIGVFGIVSYLNSTATPEVEAAAAFISLFVPALIFAFGVQLFLLILCLLPSKSRAQGNKYATDA